MASTFTEIRSALYPAARGAVDAGEFADTLGRHQHDEHMREHYARLLASYDAAKAVNGQRRRSSKLGVAA